MSSTSKFKVKKITKINDLVEGIAVELPESDLSIETSDSVIQFEYVEEKDQKNVLIKPGCFSMEMGQAHIVLKELELRNYELLESIDNTSQILNESNKFFNRLDVYSKLKREPKRSILLASPPGVGKTAAISKVCEKFLEDSGTVVVVWDTSAIKSSEVNRFFLRISDFHESVKRMIFIMEDIGGGTVEHYHGAKSVDSSLLNLLDGVGKPFKNTPTFIIATTNNPEQSVGALVDRPGRFDKVIFMDTPSEEESIQLLRFISKKESLSEEEVRAAKLAAKEKFSIAHLQEVVVRSLLDDISMLEATVQLVEHKKNYKKEFQQTNSIGLGF